MIVLSLIKIKGLVFISWLNSYEWMFFFLHFVYFSSVNQFVDVREPRFSIYLSTTLNFVFGVELILLLLAFVVLIILDLNQKEV